MPATSLAARCTACGTVFRVVPDQLRVSEGWVRCGRCAEVFNASENLVDIETGAPRRSPEDWPQPGRPAVPQAPEPGEAAAAETPFQAPPNPPLSTPQAAAQDPDAAVGQSAEAPPTPEQPAAAADRAEDKGAAETARATAAPTAGLIATTPSFLRQAERAQRWREPRVRATLGMLALLGLLGLAAQLVHTWRDRVAVHIPAARPLLEQWCTRLGCTVPAVREIHSLTVESSGLVRVERSSIYKLQAVLRNRADIELAVPAIELSLTDAQGRLAVRKVLRADQLGAPESTLDAGRELSLQATVQVLAQADGTPAPPSETSPPIPVIVGYTIELFYP